MGGPSMNHDPLDELVADAAPVRDGDLRTPATHTAAMALMKDITTMESLTDTASPWAPTTPPYEAEVDDYLPDRRGDRRPQHPRRLLVSMAAAAIAGAVIAGAVVAG